MICEETHAYYGSQVAYIGLIFPPDNGAKKVSLWQCKACKEVFTQERK